MKNKIREFRQDKGLTQKKLAEMVSTSQQQIQRMETGLQSVRYDLALSISKVLQQPLHKIFPGADDLLKKISGTTQRGFKIIDDPKNLERFHEIGIDTDIMFTTLLCSFKGGVKKFFAIDGREKERLWELIQKDDDKFFVFHSKDRCIGINRDALLFSHFLHDVYQPSGHDEENNCDIEIYFIGENQPEKFNADFDEPIKYDGDSFIDEGELRSLMYQIELWVEGDNIFDFMDGDGETVFFDLRNVAIISIPLIWMYPELLEDEDDDENEDLG